MQSLIGSAFGIQFKSLEANTEQLNSYEAPKQQWTETQHTVDVTPKDNVNEIEDRNNLEFDKTIDVTSEFTSTSIASD